MQTKGKLATIDELLIKFQQPKQDGPDELIFQLDRLAAYHKRIEARKARQEG